MMTINLHDTFDAREWTREWMRIIKERPGIPTDEGSMIGWFASAIMAGYDYARRNPDPPPPGSGQAEGGEQTAGSQPPG